MRLPQTLLWLLAFITTIHALALPAAFNSITDSTKDLFKRKGGGGGGGKGGGGGSSSSGSGGGRSGSGSSSSGSGSSGSGSGSSGSGSRGGSGSTSGGGRTTSAPPSYGGGRGGGSYYAGGASQAYGAGAARGGIRPGYIAAGAGAGFLGGALLFGAYTYPYHHPYYYHNTTSNQNQTLPVECFCEQYTQCGCDEANNSTDFVNSVANDPKVSHVAMVNGTKTLVVNGTVPNVTDDSTTASGAGSVHMSLTQLSGWWVVVGGVAYTMWFM